MISHDGADGAVYDPESGLSVPLKLPPIQEGRREIIFTANGAKEPPHPALVEQARQPWYFAMDLDRHDKVTRIAAFSVLDGSWIEQAIPEPVDRSAVNYTGLGQIFILGRRIYAFSGRANRFGVLEFPSGSSWTLSPHNPFHVENNGRLYQFNYATGDWDDVYARAIEHAHKPAGVDRRVAPDQ